MKNIVSLLIVVSMIFVVVSCGNKNKEILNDSEDTTKIPSVITSRSESKSDSSKYNSQKASSFLTGDSTKSNLKSNTESYASASTKSALNTSKKTVTSSKQDEHIHSYTKLVTTPTCGENGYSTYSCNCGDFYRNEYTSKTYNHHFIYKELSGINDDGDQLYYSGIVCSACHLEVIIQEHLEDINHAYTNVKYYIAGNKISNKHDKELVIYGSGAIPDFSDKFMAPWATIMSGVSKITITDGITVIGTSAFAKKYPAVTDISIGKDVKTLKSLSLYGLRIDKLKLGEGIQEIENYAINYEKTTWVYWPKTLKYISDIPPMFTFINYQGDEKLFNKINVAYYYSYITMEEYLKISYESSGFIPSVFYNAW